MASQSVPSFCICEVMWCLCKGAPLSQLFNDLGKGEHQGDEHQVGERPSHKANPEQLAIWHLKEGQ